MKELKLSVDLALPVDTTVTSTLVVYGGKGMGKTNLGSVLVEELARCELRWAWLDPLGVSWGLRHSADGAGPGIECLILGGPKGDIPIEPEGGAAVADVVIEEPHNVLVDFSRRPSGEMWSVGEKIRFVTAYAQRLFQRQGQLVAGRRREPLFQVLDEAARYIPQVIPSGAQDVARCVGAWEQLVEEGRNVGLGVGLLTQRSARMNKSVSELADAMFAFRTVGPNSLAAVLDWLGEHVEKARIKDLGEKVRSLERGHALVVSPGWLKFEGVVKVRLRETFDSSATPKAGERARVARGAGAQPDLAKIRERMAITIEKAKAEDPRELRKRILELERTIKGQAVLAKEITSKPAPPTEPPRVVEKLILKDAQVKRLEKAAGRLETAIEGARAAAGRAQQAAADAIHGAQQIRAALAAAGDAQRGAAGRILAADGRSRAAAPHLQSPAPAAVRPSTPAVSRAGNGGGHACYGRASEGPIHRRLLTALAQTAALTSHRKLALLASVKRGGSTWRAGMAKCRRNAWIREQGEAAEITPAGLEALGSYDPLPTGPALIDLWKASLPKGARLALEVIIGAHPEAATPEAVAAGIGAELGGSTMRAALAMLRGLELIERKGELRAAEDLF